MILYVLIVAFILTWIALPSVPAKASAERRSALQAPNSELKRKDEKLRREFDAVILKSLLDPVLTVRSGSVGLGKAGRYWQSLMSEHLARQIADSRQLSLLNLRHSAPRAKREIWVAEKGELGSCNSRDCPHGGAWHTSVKREPALARSSLIERSRTASENAADR